MYTTRSGAAIPIVHRVIQSHSTMKSQLMLTKGDNNTADDRGLYKDYNPHMDWLERDMIVGKVRWCVFC